MYQQRIVLITILGSVARVLVVINSCDETNYDDSDTTKLKAGTIKEE